LNEPGDGKLEDVEKALDRFRKFLRPCRGAKSPGNVPVPVNQEFGEVPLDGSDAEDAENSGLAALEELK
jgi:hypothetical protein